jgi:hypothetical protein
MASRKTKVKKIIAKKLPKFELDVYSAIVLSDLVIFGVSYLEEKGVNATTEEIVSISFRLFPHDFGLKNYPRWPDSALVIRRLNDAREKKNIKGNSVDGFALTYKGKLIAKRVAKALGIVKPITKKKQVVSKKRPIAIVLPKKAAAKRTQQPVGKVLVKQQKKQPVKLTVTKAVAQKKPSVQKAEPKQLTLALPPVQVKKKVEAPSKQLAVKAEAIPVSKEEKVKAGKVIKLVERSDAYHLYKKNGKHARISEFDFRNMLFTTMESSSDTLTRNVETFKRYASIHNRNDLITFLNFCEDNFASLLKKKVKA